MNTCPALLLTSANIYAVCFNTCFICFTVIHRTTSYCDADIIPEGQSDHHHNSFGKISNFVYFEHQTNLFQEDKVSGLLSTLQKQCRKHIRQEPGQVKLYILTGKTYLLKNKSRVCTPVFMMIKTKYCPNKMYLTIQSNCLKTSIEKKRLFNKTLFEK